MGMIGKNYIFYLIAIFASIFSGIYITTYSKGYDIETKEIKGNILNVIKENIPYTSIYVVISLIIYMLSTYVIDKNVDIVNTSGILKYAEMIMMLPSLLSIGILDKKYRKIPNRLNMNLLIISLAFTMLNGLLSITMLKDRVYAFLLAGIIYIVMYYIGRLMYGKDAMGLGDIKLILAVSLSLGVLRIIDVTIITFLVATISSIVISIYKSRKNIRDDYIPFGTFLIFGIIVTQFMQIGTITKMISHIF